MYNMYLLYLLVVIIGKIYMYFVIGSIYWYD